LTNGISEEDYPYIKYYISIYGRLSEKHREIVKEQLCNKLKIKYDTCGTFKYFEHFVELPGSEPPRGILHKGGLELPSDADDRDKTPIKTDKESDIIFNLEKARILNDALALGCDWAKKELMKFKDLKMIDNKTLITRVG
jgi:hypothetical protein